MKRLAVFAHYDLHNRIEDYVVYYLQELQKVCEQIVFVSDSELSDAELSKITPYVFHTISYRHGEYDFGSYKRGYQWARDNGLLEHCEELVLANDSCYAPLYPFDDMFSKMSVKDVDFWGATANPKGIGIKDGQAYENDEAHVQSYFVVFKPHVFKTEMFDNFMNSVKKENTKEEVIAYYEVGLSKLLKDNGYQFDVYCPLSKKIEGAHLLGYRQLIFENQSPFLKRSLVLYKNLRKVYPIAIKNLVTKHTEYDYELIKTDRAKNKSNNISYRGFKSVIKTLRRSLIKIHFNTKEIYFLGQKYCLCNKNTFNRKILVHLHLYYENQLDYFINKLKNIVDCDWDLYVTVIRNNEKVNKKILGFKPEAKIIQVENKGYDIWPFIQVIRDADINKYDYVLKLHTKRNNHGAGRVHPHLKISSYSWGHSLVRALLGSKIQFRKNLENLERNQEIGIISSEKFILNTDGDREPDKDITNELRERFDISVDNKDFVAGTIFLSRACIFRQLVESDISDKDFDTKVQSGVGGTISHGLERILSLLAKKNGYLLYGNRDIVVSFRLLLRDISRNILHIENSEDRTHKEITLCGIRFCFARFKEVVNK